MIGIPLRLWHCKDLALKSEQDNGLGIAVDGVHIVSIAFNDADDFLHVKSMVSTFAKTIDGRENNTQQSLASKF